MQPVGIMVSTLPCDPETTQPTHRTFVLALPTSPFNGLLCSNSRATVHSVVPTGSMFIELPPGSLPRCAGIAVQLSPVCADRWLGQSPAGPWLLRVVPYT